MLTIETGGLERGEEIAFGAPGFVDAPLDYHLSPVSPAIDFCPGSLVGEARPDLDLGQRGVDAANADRSAGATFDLGADELGAVEGLFLDGFESGGVELWSASF